MNDDERRKRDEREVYSKLDVSEQKAIRFLLDCAASRVGFNPVRMQEWIAEDKYNPWHVGSTLAAYNCLAIVTVTADRLANAKNWTNAGLNATVFFGDAVSIAVFCVRNGFIRTFDGFDFLFVRFFGGLVRPLTPSLFAASILHPDVLADSTDAEELEKAVLTHQSGPDTHDPVWFPNHPIPPLKPLRPSL